MNERVGEQDDQNIGGDSLCKTENDLTLSFEFSSYDMMNHDFFKQDRAWQVLRCFSFYMK